MSDATTNENGMSSEDAAPQTEGMSKFDELPDAPPKRRMKWSWTGKAGISVLIFWIFICFFGPLISPYHEADIIADDSFTEPGDYCIDENYDVVTDMAEAEGEVTCTNHILGTDYLGRDILARVLYGARTTLGIAVAATLLAYFVGVTLGIAAAVGGGFMDMALSRVNDAFLSLPTIMWV